MFQFYRRTLLLLLIFTVVSCADYQLHIAPEAEKWEEELPDPNLKLTHSMYLVGDAGNAPLGGTKPALTLLKSYLDTASAESSVIFLGDNIYPVGMPPKSVESYREIAEHRLNAQIATLKNFKGRPIFLPGNHDWGRYGKKGVIRQERYVERELEKIYGDRFDKDDFFLPNQGCSGPDVIELNEQLVVVIIDTNWYLLDWDKHPNINDECEIKNRDVFKFLFNDQIRKYRTKNCVIAMHHPPYTNGTHGGKYTFKQHMFPLTEKSDNLWIPFPVIGSIAQFVRSTTGTRQDISNGIYQELLDAVVTPAKRNGEYIFASGHEHSIQYIENDDQNFIVSGAGSKQTPTALGNGALMTYGHYGFARLSFYEDGSTWLEYFIPEGEGETGKMIFRRQIKGALEVGPDNIPAEYPVIESDKKTMTVTPITTETPKVGPVHRTVLGEHWRDIYRAEYDFPVLALDTFQGGVKVLKRGGGNQTNSLRLEDAKGREWTMRALTKDATRFIPYPFNRLDAAQFIVRDNFLSTHPFAAVIIPPMADAANVYHTNPKLYYIPKQPVLGVHNDDFGGEVYLVEERPMDKWAKEETFGKPDDVEGTYDVAAEIREEYKNRVDQEWTVRTRLFDMLIGDWDRHDDQWRWTQIEGKNGKDTYRPIPRDRDQAFSKYDGMATGVARLYAPFLRQLVTYKPKLGNIKWASWSPRHFDAAFLNELTLEQWQEQARYIQENVTDEVIEEAFKLMPQPAYEYSADELKEVMKKRRDNLQDFAEDLYKHLARRVTIIGTDKRDYFVVERIDKKHTRVTVYDQSKNLEKDEKYYERIFNHNETEELFLYGLNGDDIFDVIGETKKGIKVNLIGGLDNDTFNDVSNVGSLKRKTIIYDNTEKNTVNGGKETKDRRSVEAEENTYVRRGPQYEKNIVIPLPIIGYNPDDGFLIGMGLNYTTFSFGKPDFSTKHRFRADYAFATNGLNFTYGGEFFDSFKRWDIVTNVKATNSRYSINYFGLGNETKLPTEYEEGDFDFNRVRQSNYYADIGLRKRFLGKLGDISFRPLLDVTQVQDTPGRFITDEATDLPADRFERQYYGGGIFEFNFKNVDKNGSPSHGIHFHMDYTLQTNLGDTDRVFNRFNSFWTIYFPLTAKANPVIATRIGFSAIDGDYRFFQTPSIGGSGGAANFNSLRGYRSQRFRGDSAFFHNIDFRWSTFNSKNSILPFTLGVHAGFDYGRVWLETEDSRKWHTGYGGGIWIAPIDFLTFSFGSYFSEEDRRFVLTLGQQF